MLVNLSIVQFITRLSPKRLNRYQYDAAGLPFQVDTYRRAVPYTYMEQYIHFNKFYDENGNLRMDSMSIKNNTTNEWFPWIKYEYTINSENLLVKTVQ